MEIFNKSGIIVAASLLMVGMLIACQVQEEAQPPAPVVEAVAKSLAEHGGVAAESRLREWVDQGSAVAARELGLLYTLDAAKHAEAIRLLEKAARAGDRISSEYLSSHRVLNTAGADMSNSRAVPLQVRLSEANPAK